MGAFGGTAAPLVVGRAWRDEMLDYGVDAVQEGHLLAGTALLAETRDQPDLRMLRGQALAEAAIGRARGIAELGARDPENPDIAFWLGMTRVAEAWSVLTRYAASAAGRQRFEEFRTILQTAEAPLTAAAQLLPGDPAPWVGLQSFALGMRWNRPEQDEIWGNIRFRAPLLFAGAWGRVETLAPRAGGSEAEMLAFARETARIAPDGDPVVAVLAMAHLEIFLFGPEHARGFGRGRAARRHFAEPAVHAEITEAAGKWMRQSRPHPHDVEAHHLFGFAFYQAKDEKQARYHLAAAGERVPRLAPWGCLGDAGRHYDEARRNLQLI